MGLLHKLWDETLAGPAPDSGLGKLRKYDSVSASDHFPISRSITIVRTSSDPSSFSLTPTGSPSSSRTPSPRTHSMSGTPVGDFKKLTRRKSSALASGGPADPTTPNMVIMSALDR
ncbi:dormancy-associated protein-like protein 4 isoform X1 [Senna tora]|uniref:Dormancy-associated protein-like protein 4 isoform X1 n=1 Tax=Senna tora TaxID=362788 RepID=A0A834WCD8_9FABA|nr:dormancy-associated protein-like protein 4 isoform X1 [Senna tora]